MHVGKRPHTELCVLLAIRFLIANKCTRCCIIFEELSQNGAQAELAENIRATFFDEDLSFDTTFGQIHLDVQYF